MKPFYIYIYIYIYIWRCLFCARYYISFKREYHGNISFFPFFFHHGKIAYQTMCLGSQARAARGVVEPNQGQRVLGGETWAAHDGTCPGTLGAIIGRPLGPATTETFPCPVISLVVNLMVNLMVNLLSDWIRSCSKITTKLAPNWPPNWPHWLPIWWPIWWPILCQFCCYLVFMNAMILLQNRIQTDWQISIQTNSKCITKQIHFGGRVCVKCRDQFGTDSKVSWMISLLQFISNQPSN